MKKLFLVYFVILSTLHLNAQKAGYSINLDFHYPYLASSEQDYEYYPSSTGYVISPGFKESYDAKTGIKLSGQVKFNLANNLSIGTGLNFNLIRFKRNIEIVNPYADLIENVVVVDSNLIIGSPIGYIGLNEILSSGDQNDDVGKTNILYTEIPIYLNYSLFNQKVSLAIGLTASFLTYSSVYIYDVDNTYLYSFPEVVKDKTSDGLSNLMWSGNIEIEYLVFRNIGAKLSYTRSFNSVYDEDEIYGNPKYNLFTLGVSYHL
ncbi:MAG TPA: outer membrane beta-barrel protein [Bacteroidales bacterium]|nr:outer membrane beta-barrel protein [Bacteroidales bacterium]